MRGDPAGRGGDPGADIAAVSVGLLGDQREVPFGIGVTEHEVAIGAELRIQLRQLTGPPCRAP